MLSLHQTVYVLLFSDYFFIYLRNAICVSNYQRSRSIDDTGLYIVKWNIIFLEIIVSPLVSVLNSRTSISLISWSLFTNLAYTKRNALLVGKVNSSSFSPNFWTLSCTTSCFSTLSVISSVRLETDELFKKMNLSYAICVLIHNNWNNNRHCIVSKWFHKLHGCMLSPESVGLYIRHRPLMQFLNKNVNKIFNYLTTVTMGKSFFKT